MDTKELISKIRNYEAQAAYAVRTNEQQLPKIKALLAQATNFNLDVADQDIAMRIVKLQDAVNTLKPDNLAGEELERIRAESIMIRDTLVRRYQERLTVYENRYCDL